MFSTFHLDLKLRFLRLPQFTRKAFWKNNISDPYYERNPEALKVIRSLLSRVIVRHSKEQTFNGEALLSLPPRNVHTELVEFGSEAERKVYETIESRNLQYFQSLHRRSPATVLAKFLQLTGMLYSLRQGCSHVSMLNLDQIDAFNRTLHSGTKPRTTGEANTRAAILDQAVEKAKPSAERRVRQIVLQFQEGEIEFLECPVCLEPAGEVEVAITPCGHQFCKECILNIVRGGSSTRESSGRCPHCRDIIMRSGLTFLGDATDAGIHSKDKTEEGKDGIPKKNAELSGEVNGFEITMKEDIVTATAQSNTRRVGTKPLTEEERRERRAYHATLSPEFLEAYESASITIGTKVSRLLEEINAMTSKNDSSKCVVFSQFLGVLDVAAQEMKARGIQFVRVDGSMKQYERADALLDFSSDRNVRVFLLSMRAGAVGLNLTAADHCFIMDVPQNSATEEQAIDRIHRIGQTRPVTVKRFVMKGTIEERILSVRRSLVSDGAAAVGSGTAIDGAGLLKEEEDAAATGAAAAEAERRGWPPAAKRPRLNEEEEDDDDQGTSERSRQRLENLEILFGYNPKWPVNVVKA